MKRLLLLIVIVLEVGMLFAGKYAGDFLSLGSGVRSIAMGGAVSAVGSDINTIYWNSSNLSQFRSPKVEIMHAIMYNGLASYENIAICNPLQNEVTVALSWTRLSINDINYYDESHLIGTTIDQRLTDIDLQLPATPDKKFDSKDDLLLVAFSRHIPVVADLGWFLYELPIDYYFGATLKYISRSVLDKKGTGTGFDVSGKIKTSVGALLDVEDLGNIAFALNMQDIGGTNIIWNTESRKEDEVLFNTKIGLSYEQVIKKNKKVTIAYDKDFTYNEPAHIGVNYASNNIWDVSLGYTDSNFSAGAGFKYKQFEFQYAFVTNVLGNTNRLGLGIAF